MNAEDDGLLRHLWGCAILRTKPYTQKVHVLAKLPPHDGPRIVYGEACRLSAARLRREGGVFRQVPYEIKVT